MGRPVLGKDETLRHHIGFGPDAPPAYEELTVDQYLGFIGGAYGLTRETTGERADFWLEQLWLTEKRRSPIKHLSKGMRQRVTLARTFLPQPHVILLDEPLSGLDPAGRIELRRVLGMLREQGCAMIVSSHILSDLEEVATHVAIIERGRILRWAATRELVQHDATVCTYELITVGGDDHYDGLLAGLDGVSNVTRDDRRYRFDYRVGEREAAGLLRQLVGLGIPVVAFHAVKATLEDAYLRAGVRQVD
jgi:ABC-2 type transport system ATP-binding protein